MDGSYGAYADDEYFDNHDYDDDTDDDTDDNADGDTDDDTDDDTDEDTVDDTDDMGRGNLYMIKVPARAAQEPLCDQGSRARAAQEL